MDIETLINDDSWIHWRSKTYERLVGGGPDDSERLRRASPIRRAAEIRAPVLLAHGLQDQRVAVHHSQQMARALRKHRKDYELLEFEHEIHGFLLERNRIEFYERLIAFFEEHLRKGTPGGLRAPCLRRRSSLR